VTRLVNATRCVAGDVSGYNHYVVQTGMRSIMQHSTPQLAQQSNKAAGQAVLRISVANTMPHKVCNMPALASTTSMSNGEAHLPQ
jgi:hypothetical protein